MQTKVFECGPKSQFGAVYLSDAQKTVQLIFRDGEETRVVRIPANFRKELAMRLLSMDGAKVDVRLSWVPPKALAVMCPHCGARPETACLGVKKQELKKTHRERAGAARASAGTLGYGRYLGL